MIDQKLQEELRARFNPEGSDLRKAQLRMLEMLKYIDKVCKENNIKYWLSSGSCLGAVRHGGFIPWDDDVDIEMLNLDFQKFRKIIQRDPSHKYLWQDVVTDTEFNYPFAKLRDQKSIIDEIGNHDIKYRMKGLFIDIFVITPSNSLWLRRCTTFIYNFFIKKNCCSRSLSRKLLRYSFIPFLETIQSLFSRGRLRHVSGSYFYNPRYIEDIEDIIYMKFEDTELPVPKNYQHYLSLMFSEYEKLPDLDSIKPHLAKVRFIPS